MSVQLERVGDIVRFLYRVVGSGVRFSPFSNGSRRDELWKTTCFEFFIGPAGQPSYFEINMATSGDWNVYAFDDYRAGMKPVAGVRKSPLKAVRATGDGLELEGEFRLSEFPLLGPVVLGATAVVEYLDGSKDYWALAHNGEKPDFHIHSSFIASIEG